MTQTIRDIATALGAEAVGDLDLVVERPAEPQAAEPGDLALAMTPAYADALRGTKAHAAVLWPEADWEGAGLRAAIFVPRARLAMARLTQALDAPLSGGGVDETARFDPSAHLGPDLRIGAYTVIGPAARIGPGGWIDTHVSIGEEAEIGPGAIIHAGVRIGRGARIGANVRLHPGAVIGADGFSFVTEGPSNEERAVRNAGREPLEPPPDGTRHRIHSLGSVVIGDDVEIGANATVDAGTIRPTRIGSGTKIDNLVQVGHNVTLGSDCVLSAQAAVAGSARLGDRVVMGGKSGIRDNVTVGRDVVLGGGAIVLEDVADGQFVMGYPARPMPLYRQVQRALRRLAVSKD